MMRDGAGTQEERRAVVYNNRDWAAPGVWGFSGD
jgi:hypothetical protein